eukprot:g2288.t1
MKRSSAQESHKPWYCRRYLWIGFFCLTLNGAGLDWVAFMFAPLSLVAPLGALTIVFSNVLAALGILVDKEGVPGPLAVLSNFVIIAGIVTTGVFGPHSSDTHTIAEMAADATRPQFIAYAVPSLVVIAGYLVARCVWKSKASIIKCCWCALASASCAALSQMCLKIVAEALNKTIGGDNQFIYFGTYLAAVGIAVFAPLNVRLLEEALAASTASYGITVYQTLIVLTTILAGGSFFNEFADFASSLDQGLFWGGVAIDLLGLLLLSYAMRGKSSPPGNAEGAAAAAAGTTAYGTNDGGEGLPTTASSASCGSHDVGERRPSFSDRMAASLGESSLTIMHRSSTCRVFSTRRATPKQMGLPVSWSYSNNMHLGAEGNDSGSD